MKNISGFPAVAGKNAKLLILGSMPSEASLQKQQYYGHQRNAFWSIMMTLFCDQPNHSVLPYTQRKRLLIENNIAVWDVLKNCHRDGSLDTAIKMDSIKTNNFLQFFLSHPDIKKVFFNGLKAEAIYIKHVLSTLNKQFSDLEYCRLPSTSPAHASITLKQKTAIWKKEIKDYNNFLIKE
ncbi:MAG: DNA-deoxyinosine glycosylase [Methylococcales bacterium]|nr:DNA-deoxyinosine glycosylase [Methylococcales bacterium]